MKRTARRLRAGGILIALVAAMAITTPTAAVALGEKPPPLPSPDVTTVQGMHVAYYDEAVASANGYAIVTDQAGRQRSEPITEEAKARAAQRTDPAAIAAQKQLGGMVSTNALVYDEVVGDCGLSYVGAEKISGDRVPFETGFIVRDAVRSWTWRIQANAFISGDSRNFGGGATGPEVDRSGTMIAVGPGTAFVPGFSNSALVTLVDGAVCYSGGPSVGFG